MALESLSAVAVACENSNTELASVALVMTKLEADVLSLFLPSLTLQSNLIHYLGLSHRLLALNFIIVSLSKKSAWSSAQVKVTDTDFDGVEVRVFEGSPKPGEPLRRSVVYIHGGGWALASASMSWSPSSCLGLWLALGET